MLDRETGQIEMPRTDKVSSIEAPHTLRYICFFVFILVSVSEKPCSLHNLKEKFKLHCLCFYVCLSVYRVIQKGCHYFKQ